MEVAMADVERCARCGVPLMISRELEWGNNGVITLKRSPANRMILYESRVIDNLFRGIEELIGLPIEHIVIESRRREVKKYIQRSLPPEVREMIASARDAYKEGITGRDPAGEKVLREITRTITREIIEIGRIYGYGDSRPGDTWEMGDPFPWRSNVVRNPYSVPFWAADALGSNEAVEGIDQWVRYERLDEDTYLFVTYPAGHPLELKERLKRRRYSFKPGEIVFERCEGCGLPAELARYEWKPEQGIINDPDYGWRMAIYGPSALEVVLEDLQAELGEEVPAAVIEAERRFVKERARRRDWRRGRTTFNRLSALRGMGNVTRFEADEKHLSLTIENACLPLLMVGMAQAIYELALNRESSRYEYHFADDGDLSIEVRVD
ncbi:MAG: hypothetical protein H5T74_09280 [Actinobacteria bacterium]|nr:hypothetical protein [Actinomycetota bacterium]MBC7230564.1 hypothetical protein [Actinomycetota bacterium]